MTTIKSPITRETEAVDDEGRTVLLTLHPGGTIELRAKGRRGSGRTISVGDLWARLGDGPRPAARAAQPAAGTRAEVIRDLRSKLHTLPRSGGVALLNEALDAVEALDAYLESDEPDADAKASADDLRGAEVWEAQATEAEERYAAQGGAS